MSCRFRGLRSRGAGKLGITALLLATPLEAYSQGSSPSSVAPQLPGPSYTAHRVYDSRHKRFIDFEQFVTRLITADLVFVGEQHNDPATHRMELALLEGIARRRDSVVLALEMFERDVQPFLDRYLRGEFSEDSLLAGARPWKNYASDYRPLVELARARGWPVVASNVPRSVASRVARGGLPALDTILAVSRPDVAQGISCPEDEYFKRFTVEMGDMASHGPAGSAPATPEQKRVQLERIYQAQCVKDETMGESVASVWRPGRLVIHYNGAFHTDFRLGTAERVQRRAPGARMIVVTAMPVKELDRLKPSKEDRKRADYLLYVLAPAKADSTSS